MRLRLRSLTGLATHKASLESVVQVRGEGSKGKRDVRLGVVWQARRKETNSQEGEAVWFMARR